MAAKWTCAALALLASAVPAANAAAAPARLPGIDVSRFQGTIDWESVADAGSGSRSPRRAAARATTARCAPRRCGPDERYDANYALAKAVGIRVGPYHRAFVGGDGRAGVMANAKAEAKVFIASVGALDRGDLKPALDLETPFAGLSPAELRIWARTWLDRGQARARRAADHLHQRHQLGARSTARSASPAPGTRSGSQTGTSAVRPSPPTTGPATAGASGSTRATATSPGSTAGSTSTGCAAAGAG